MRCLSFGQFHRLVAMDTRTWIESSAEVMKPHFAKYLFITADDFLQGIAKSALLLSKATDSTVLVCCSDTHLVNVSNPTL